MGSINATNRQKLIQFAYKQMMENNNGIGNECTHLIYAALFESRSLDGTTELWNKPRIQQVSVPYTWGEPLKKLTDAQPGDIVQFHDQRSDFEFFGPKNNVNFWKKRGPKHTGILLTPVSQHFFSQIESHLTDPAIVHMRARIGTIFYRHFNLAITANVAAANASAASFAKDINAILDDSGKAIDTKVSDIMKTINAAAFSSQLQPVFTDSIVKDQDYGKARATWGKGKAWQHDGSAIQLIMRHSSIGSISAYVPQESAKRGAMNAAAMAQEKALVIKQMYASGRKGSETQTEHGAGDHGDDKKERFAAGLFNWKSM